MSATDALWRRTALSHEKTVYFTFLPVIDLFYDGTNKPNKMNNTHRLTYQSLRAKLLPILEKVNNTSTINVNA